MSRMKPLHIGRLSIAIALTVIAAPLAFFNGAYGALGVEAALSEHLLWSYPGALAGLVYAVLLFFSLGFATCTVVVWRWYFMARMLMARPERPS